MAGGRKGVYYLSFAIGMQESYGKKTANKFLFKH